jgi:hypothetical protein
VRQHGRKAAQRRALVAGVISASRSKLIGKRLVGLKAAEVFRLTGLRVYAL